MTNPKPIYEMVRKRIAWEHACEICGDAFRSKKAGAKRCKKKACYNEMRRLQMYARYHAAKK